MDYRRATQAQKILQHFGRKKVVGIISWAFITVNSTTSSLPKKKRVDFSN
jgi:hypothetical protein